MRVIDARVNNGDLDSLAPNARGVKLIHAGPPMDRGLCVASPFGGALCRRMPHCGRQRQRPGRPGVDDAVDAAQRPDTVGVRLDDEAREDSAAFEGLVDDWSARTPRGAVLLNQVRSAEGLESGCVLDQTRIWHAFIGTLCEKIRRTGVTSTMNLFCVDLASRLPATATGADSARNSASAEQARAHSRADCIVSDFKEGGPLDRG